VIPALLTMYDRIECDAVCLCTLWRFQDVDQVFKAMSVDPSDDQNTVNLVALIRFLRSGGNREVCIQA
jgi:hypothetical protein